MIYPNKKIYHFGTILIMTLLFMAYGMGYILGHETMLRQCQDIMSSKLPVPSPIYAFNG